MMKEYKINDLKICIYEDKNHVGKAAADLAESYINKAITRKGEAVVVFASAASQFEFLESLITKEINWKRVVAFHLDEYIGISKAYPASFRKFLFERIIDKVDIGTYYLIEGDQTDPGNECKRIGNIFDQYQVDAAFIGIGENGHLAFNDPPANFHDKVNFKIVELDEISRNQQYKEGWFKILDEVPKRAITMTIPAIMASQAIVCIVPDLRKAEAVKLTLEGIISPDIPASILREHPRATLLLDIPSASLLSKL